MSCISDSRRHFSVGPSSISTLCVNRRLPQPPLASYPSHPPTPPTISRSDPTLWEMLTPKEGEGGKRCHGKRKGETTKRRVALKLDRSILGLPRSHLPPLRSRTSPSSLACFLQGRGGRHTCAMEGGRGHKDEVLFRWCSRSSQLPPPLPCPRLMVHGLASVLLLSWGWRIQGKERKGADAAPD